jgi:hypothetical protein
LNFDNEDCEGEPWRIEVGVHHVKIFLGKDEVITLKCYTYRPSIGYEIEAHFPKSSHRDTIVYGTGNEEFLKKLGFKS